MGVNMTYQGMHRDNASRQSQYYILINNSVLGHGLPEKIQASEALRLANAGTADGRGHDHHDMDLLRVSERLQDDPALEAEVSAYWMTPRGLLIRGTENAAYRLSTVFDVPLSSGASAASAPSIMSGVCSAFRDCVDYYRGRALKGVEAIQGQFDALAGAVAANDHRPSVPAYVPMAA